MTTEPQLFVQTIDADRDGDGNDRAREALRTQLKNILLSLEYSKHSEPGEEPVCAPGWRDYGADFEKGSTDIFMASINVCVGVSDDGTIISNAHVTTSIAGSK